MTDLQSFAQALFPDAISPLIEVRIIEDKRGGAVVFREWYVGVDSLLGDFERLKSVAATRNAAIYFGVLPRLCRGGKTEDVGTGMVVWVDIDFHDFSGGEREARGRLDAFPHRPSFVVRSGHGLHAYWLVREPTDPAILSAISKRLATYLGGDHAFDVARILRLPATFNRKDPASPILVEIETSAPERAYNPSDLEEALDLLAPAEDPRGASTPPPSASSESGGPPLTPRLRSLLQRDRRVRSLFEGTGKPELGRDGRRQDTTSSGYDFSLAIVLLKKGVPVDEVGVAIWHRPDEAARTKGQDYIARTVAKAEAIVVESKCDDAAAAAVEIDFEVTDVRVFQSVPPLYFVTVDGVMLELSSSDLLVRSAFTRRFLEGLKRIPRLPEGDAWVDLVNGWLATARIDVAPPDASEEAALQEAVSSAIDNLPVGDERADLDGGKALRIDDGRTAFKATSILTALREDWPQLRRNKLCSVLERLGYGVTWPTLDGKSVRVWAPANTQ